MPKPSFSSFGPFSEPAFRPCFSWFVRLEGSLGLGTPYRRRWGGRAERLCLQQLRTIHRYCEYSNQTRPAAALPFFAAEARKRMEAGGRTGGKKAGRGRTGGSPIGDKPIRHLAADDAAQAFNTSTRNV
jgi:hypothetical protein